MEEEEGGWKRREQGGGAARPLLEGSPGLAAAARASQCGSRLARAAAAGWSAPSDSTDASRFRALCGAYGRSGHGRLRRGRGRVAEAQSGPPPTCRCPPAAGSGKAGIWRLLLVFQPTSPGTRPPPSGRPRDSTPRAPRTAAVRLPEGSRGALGTRAASLRTARICPATPQPLLYSFPFLFLKRHSVRKYLAHL